MAVQTKHQDFVDYVLRGVFDLRAAGDQCFASLHLTAPQATDGVFADLTEISAGNGYTAGGQDMQQDMTESTGTATVTAVDITWTASGGAIADFRYADFYDDTPTTPADPLISFVDYGSTLSLAAGESFTLDFAASFATLA